ncbi:hypothetical protein U1Q18_011300 [Sarracenia purpurea var. burkii]
MALETLVFQQDPFSYNYKEDLNLYTIDDGGGGYSYRYTHGFEEENVNFETPDGENMEQCFRGYWDSSSPLPHPPPPPPPPPMAQSVTEGAANFSSPDPCVAAGDGLQLVGGDYPPVGAPASFPGRTKRRRNKTVKNEVDIENQRRTHITVERNRRKQMNHYLAELRSLMPPSYAQRGDQASIVGGAINFVKELEQLLQSLKSRNQVKEGSCTGHCSDPLFADFFTFPQYSTCLARRKNLLAIGNGLVAAEKLSTIADIEVTMVESHANIKVLSTKHPKQLLKLVAGFYSLGLTVLHLNITPTHEMVLYSFSVK